MRSSTVDAEMYGGAPTISAGEAKLLFLLEGADGGNVEGWDISSVQMGPKPGSREWRYAWSRLVELTADVDLAALDEESGECWQYMGFGCFEGRWGHSFRHRHHPILKRRWYLNVPVTRRYLCSVLS